MNYPGSQEVIHLGNSNHAAPISLPWMDSGGFMSCFVRRGWVFEDLVAERVGAGSISCMMIMDVGFEKNGRIAK